ncbi:Phenylalanine--tRNA ligase alpha subunit [Planctomycetes bacterium Pla163]|uniref:Phenylalanine--tRNA ligase alpha subunit n=1 Tax=Rohdeia mirabilis TaxID=2528008 RepID=A0A518D094_9BACT|nr:Phenylalanine--tRNA ligase alpha subunit [Planctomycetes bacterium Pla163]
MDIEAHERTVRSRIAEATDADALRAIEREYLEKGGVVADLLASIPTLPPTERKAAGQGANALKRAVTEALESRRAALDGAQLEAELAAPDFDPTIPARPLDAGSLHPITQAARRLEEIFSSMGYHVLDGPEVELDHYNFEALNIPKDHPARDMQDTFFVSASGDRSDTSGALVMRTHTSPVQVRAMERLEPPFRAIAPGRVFRQETTDATHEHTFHQMEGLVVGDGISVAHLIGTMKTFLREVFERDLDVRLRPGYFPFVEPGFELDARCPFCESGCRVCKQSRWIELCPCGLVHPNVLRAGGIDPERYSGFAFGLGLSRLVMLRYGLDDIRHLMGADVRFLEQF